MRSDSANDHERDELVRIVAENTDSHTFAGREFDREAEVETVYVTAEGYERLSEALDAAGDVIGVVKVVRVARSYQQLLDLTAAIAREAKVIQAAGIALSSWGPDMQSNSVRVGVMSDVASGQSYMDAQFGQGAVKVDQDLSEFELL
jgi:hypothetical protein